MGQIEAEPLAALLDAVEEATLMLSRLVEKDVELSVLANRFKSPEQVLSIF